MPRKPPPRLRTFDYTGFHRYFLTISTFRSARSFVDDDSVTIVLTQLERSAATEGFLVVAYCFMPDHLHVLVEGNHETADFQEFVRIFKQQSAFYWRQARKQTLWHRSYWERVLRDHDDTMTAIRYIVENPARAGLVPWGKNYPYLGSLTRSVEAYLQDGPNPTCRTGRPSGRPAR